MLAAILICSTMAIITGCNSKPTADLVVYDKIFTAEGNQAVGTVMSRDTDVDEFLKEIVPVAVKKA